MLVSWQWLWQAPWWRKPKCGCLSTVARLSSSWQFTRRHGLGALGKNRHYRYCMVWWDVRQWDNFLLRRTYQEDSMDSLVNSTSVDPETQWPLLCTGSYCWRCYAHHRAVRHPALRENMYRCDIDKACRKLFIKRAMSNCSHWQRWSRLSDEEYTSVSMFGVRPVFMPQHCHHKPTGVGSRPATCTKHSGQRSPRHPRYDKNLSPVNVRRVASRSASARMSFCNAHHRLLSTGRALSTKLAKLRWSFCTGPDSIRVL